MMFIAMNRFKIVPGKEKIFEQIWKNRKSDLKNIKGFIEFNLIKNSHNKDFTLYASHSKWENEKSFINWTQSQSFRDSHKNVGKYKNLYMGHPDFEGFHVII